jgi:hypothetical protein
MSILKKINSIFKEELILHESGFRNIKNIAKQYNKAKIFYHQDLDGITSGIAIREYLKQYNIKTIDAEMIQYGDKEYAVKTAPKGVLQVLVDFGHDKVNMQIYTDHHDHTDTERKTSTKGQSKLLPTTPSNAQAISMTISPTDIFPPKDIKAISTVDSADFAKYGLKPDDIMRSVFTADKTLNVSKNHQMMALVVNKLLLAYKNKPGFLDEIVMKAKPSLISMYNLTVKMAKERGLTSGLEMLTKTANYKNQRKEKIIPNLKISDVKNMHNGDSGLIGTTIVQTGGGAMAGNNQYDRYTIFSIHPNAEYLITEWAGMLNQLSKNPFIGRKNSYHLGDLVSKEILPKYKGKLKSIDVTLDSLKYNFEKMDVKKRIKGAMGFTFNDLMYLFKGKIKGLSNSNKWWGSMVKDITNKPYKFLSKKQKDVLKKISITAWDIITTQSGGHKDITNISLPYYLGKEMKTIQRNMTIDMAKLMKDKHLE